MQKSKQKVDIEAPNIIGYNYLAETYLKEKIV